jgi:hypothetical protein
MSGKKTDKGKHYSREQVYFTRKLVTKQLYDTEYHGYWGTKKDIWNCFMRDWEESKKHCDILLYSVLTLLICYGVV